MSPYGRLYFSGCLLHRSQLTYSISRYHHVCFFVFPGGVHHGHYPIYPADYPVCLVILVPGRHRRHADIHHSQVGANEKIPGEHIPIFEIGYSLILLHGVGFYPVPQNISVR